MYCKWATITYENNYLRIPAGLNPGPIAFIIVYQRFAELFKVN